MGANLTGECETWTGCWEGTNMFGGICESGGSEDTRETGGTMLKAIEEGSSDRLTTEERSEGTRERAEDFGRGCHCCGRWIVPMSRAIPNFHPKILTPPRKIPNLKLIPSNSLRIAVAHNTSGF